MTLTESIKDLKNTQEKAGSIFGFFLKKYFSKQLQRKLEQIDNLLIEHLSETDSTFNKLVEESLELIANSEINFKVTDEGSSPWTYMTRSFKGTIHSNGYLYLKAKRTTFEFIDFLSHFYPSRYIGSINALGMVNVKAAGRKFQILGSRVPSAYLGKITANGEIVFDTTESWFEIDGHVHVNKIIADPFKRNSIKRKAFLNNRTLIKKALNEWKKENNVGQHQL